MRPGPPFATLYNSRDTGSDPSVFSQPSQQQQHIQKQQQPCADQYSAAPPPAPWCWRPPGCLGGWPPAPGWTWTSCGRSWRISTGTGPAPPSSHSPSRRSSSRTGTTRRGRGAGRTGITRRGRGGDVRQPAEPVPCLLSWPMKFRCQRWGREALEHHEEVRDEKLQNQRRMKLSSGRSGNSSSNSNSNSSSRWRNIFRHLGRCQLLLPVEGSLPPLEDLNQQKEEELYVKYIESYTYIICHLQYLCTCISNKYLDLIC